MSETLYRYAMGNVCRHSLVLAGVLYRSPARRNTDSAKGTAGTTAIQLMNTGSLPPPDLTESRTFTITFALGV